MDSARWQRIEQAFADAIELTQGQRDAFIAQCGAGDPEFQSELRSLLLAHEAAKSPLDTPPEAGLGPEEAGARLTAGTRLGAWSLGALIGRGGSGEVYLATRADGVFQQQVAIKLLRREAASQAERFNAERQILARLEHPGIARLLDGGLSQDGRPYAVVEYVAGVPLIEHCRKTAASLDLRLALFAQVCDAVAYAHRNLVVHRDLKSGNILVTPEGRIKLLDFGIAKQLDPGAWPGGDLTFAPFTPDYAAPEQLTGGLVTTSTDVYALGVLLFELLTDCRPWASAGLPFARAVQLIVHDVPPAPSRVATAHASPPVAARRLRGDLDAIVAKCLRKEPAHRYATVDELAQDLAMHLRHAPVSAREGAGLYVVGRLLRRYRWAVAGALAVFISLAAGLAVATVQARRAELERDIARRSATREESVRYYLTSMFRASATAKGGESTTAKAMLDATAQRVLTEYRDDPLLAGKVVITLTDLYGALEDLEGQVPLLDGFLAAAGPEADPESVALARQKLAHVELLRGHGERAAELLSRAEAFWATAPDRFREQQLEAMFVRGLLQRTQGDLDGSIGTYQKAIAARTALSGAVHRETANLYNSLAISLTGANRIDEALAAYRTTLDIQQKLGHGDDLDALVMLGNTGTLAYRVGRLGEAEQILKSAYTKQRTRAGDSAAVAASMGLYGAAQTSYARYATAQSVLQEATDMAVRFAGPASPVAIQDRLFLTEAFLGGGDTSAARKLADQNVMLAQERFGANHLLTLRAMLEQARIQLTMGAADEATAQFTALLPALRKLGPAANTQLANALIGAGDSLLAQSRAGEASALFQEAVQLREKLLWDQSWELAEARARLGESLARSGRPDGLAMLRQSAAVLEAQLGERHPQTLRARRALAESGKV